MEAINKDMAAILNHIPAEGATAAQLANDLKLPQANVDIAVARLIGAGLLEASGTTLYITSFAHKARSLFNITA
jgi:hypothetical protein